MSEVILSDRGMLVWFMFVLVCVVIGSFLFPERMTLELTGYGAMPLSLLILAFFSLVFGAVIHFKYVDRECDTNYQPDSGSRDGGSLTSSHSPTKQEVKEVDDKLKQIGESRD